MTTTEGKTPEKRHAWLTTIEWRWGDDEGDVILKLFPDVLLFYGFLWATSLCAALASACPPFGRALARRVPRLRCSVGQLAMGAALAMTGALFARLLSTGR